MKTNATVGGTSKGTNVSAEQVYHRGLALAKVHLEVSLVTILCYLVTVALPSLFKEDGRRRKTSKANLLHALEDTVKNL